MIIVNDLSFSYPGSKVPVLKNLHFQISKGEIFGFLGPSGAGKTTAQKVLYKILHNFQGEVIVKGKSLKKWDRTYFENIGVGFELPNHYLKLTGRENLQLFASFYPKDRILNFDFLFDLVGLESSADQKVEAYSKGMKMRLSFIRAIMHDPDILFFDEPTAGLDPVNGHKLKEYIVSLKSKGKTIFITTHDMTTADEICDRVSFIIDGKLDVTEKPNTLKQQYGKRIVKIEVEKGDVATFPLLNLGTNPYFLSFIHDKNIVSINSQEATLEEVFIKITGQSLQQ